MHQNQPRTTGLQFSEGLPILCAAHGTEQLCHNPNCPFPLLTHHTGSLHSFRESPCMGLTPEGCTLETLMA